VLTIASSLSLLVYDFDGVMTNNSVSVDREGHEFVTCTRADGLGVDRIRSLGIPQIILSTETNPVVRARADKLKLPVLQGVADKAEVLADFSLRQGCDPKKILYVGNDVNDLAAMESVGYRVCPADAHPSIRAVCHLITRAKGGEGVIRELSDWLVRPLPVEGNYREGTAPGLNAVRDQLAEGIRLRQTVLGDELLLQRIHWLAQAVFDSLSIGGKVIFAGNGGSFADAQHLAAEFVGRFIADREPLSAACLGTNGSLTTAISNDYRFEDVFAREFKALVRPGDVFIAISTSGESGNLVQAVELAEQMGITVFGLLGKTGGQIARLVPSIVVPHTHTGHIQEMHITIGHIVCELVDRRLQGILSGEDRSAGPFCQESMHREKC
jgi:D-sedoheptulose 7-phosphate isomerase